ncbi:hypothetical protein PsorP6_014013 [Peronosclerospora sorghi]|uniref:Uncharacterized protein n=1 Tax=Peronosclerospora sorghi TaxID=230839 RepID=A0ACC0VGG2_9STRA|nr:hypothetical protein PsorP6_014013 [Peronosclerospora sorghi]
MERDDGHGTLLLLQCHGCGLYVHVNCYGVRLSSAEDTSSWLCQACAYLRQDDGTPRVPPQCAVCPISSGALRRTTQRNVWCHVLCSTWIPELSRTLAGVMDEVVDISVLDKSRSALRCLVCGLRGGCIQCVSGRCAKAFHVLCALRCPSSVLFTGYDVAQQQVYHCKTHLSDVQGTTTFELMDPSWRRVPEVQAFVKQHAVTSATKCRFCSTKVTSSTKEGHETVCVLGWMARQDAHKRKRELERLGLAPVEITYQEPQNKAVVGAKKGAGRARSRHSPRHVANGKFQRQATPPPLRACPECGQSVRETLMMGHLRNSCVKSRHAPALKRRKQHLMSPRSSTASGMQSETEATDLSGVLFGSWPGQTSGAPMDSTYFWKVVETQFFSTKGLEKKRMDQVSKSLCGVKLDEIAKASRRRPLQASDIHCRDTMRFERSLEDPREPVVLTKLSHKCDFLMRASHCRCLSDPFAKPMLEIYQNGVDTNETLTESVDASLTRDPDSCDVDINVLFENGEKRAVGCSYSLHLLPNDATTDHQAADNATIASRFQHDVMSTLVGFEMQTNKVTMLKDKKLLISLNECKQVDDISVENWLDTSFQTSSSGSLCQDTPVTDEITPVINLLMEYHKDTTEQNRYRLLALYKKLQRKEDEDSRFQLQAQTTTMFYREFAAWKRLCLSLVAGYSSSDQCEVKQTKTSESKEVEESTENEDDAIDDGICVVCFDGQSPETNPIIFCDRCELAVHQRCYGMAKVPSNEFICDRCLASREGLDPVRNVFCQLCSLSDGAFKRTLHEKWVHVVCALWCPNVWIGNLFELSDICLGGRTNQVRFLNSAEEIQERIEQAAGFQTSTPNHDKQLDVSTIEGGDLCLHCRVACGRTIRCCYPGCSTSFHPLCGWFEGLPMTVSHGDHRYIYAGGGAGLKFEVFCSHHFPAMYPASEQLVQRRRRARCRIDSYFVMHNKENYRTYPKKTSQDVSSLLSGSIIQAVLSAERKTTETSLDGVDAMDWTDMRVCSACFEYCSPIVGDLVDVHLLHRRQFMIRCQKCNVSIHPECCISDIGSSATIFRRNWICERCTQTSGKSAPTCIVCAKATDYLMPCIDAPDPITVPTASPSIAPVRVGGSNGEKHRWLQAPQTMQGPYQMMSDDPTLFPQCQGRERNGVSLSLSTKWIHVYCAKWQKTKTVKRQYVLCAYMPRLKSESPATRCDLCDKKEGILANCAQCYRRFHPICAAQKKFFCARSNRVEWKFYCEAHPPVDAAFDVTRQSWMTHEILGQLQDVRRSLERGRMLLEMARQRDRQQKRLLNLCTWPLVENLIEMIMKKRPTAQMKEMYYDLTGETLTDVPHRAKFVAPLPRKPQKSRGKSHARNNKRSGLQATVERDRNSKRRRTRCESDASSSSGDHYTYELRQRSLRSDERNGGEEEPDEEMDVHKVWADLAVPTERDDFDFMIPEVYSELVVRG